MAALPPPPPVKSEPGSFAWMDWYKKLYDFISVSGSIAWSQINFAGSTLTSIATRLHSNLQGIVGTGAYHISAAEGTEVTALLTATGTGNYVKATSPTLVTPKLTGYTVGTLPAGTVGMYAYVTDATAPTFNGALVGGGAVVVPVFYNGTIWVSV